MNNIKKAAKFVTADPQSRESKALLDLAIALETDAPFAISTLYDIDRDAFKLAMGLIEDWRLDRHYLSKLKLLDSAELQSEQTEVAA